jgi:succinoglycan biosynthesis protein ExoM
MLGRLVQKLAKQNTGNIFDYSLVIVDNDETGAAQSIVKSLQKELGLVIIYSIERTRSIAAVRNHALRLAKGNYIAIIDDDEFPPVDWLITLYNAIQTFDVDGALGPVYPFFDSQPPDWIIKGGFCERSTHRTGTLLRWNQTRTGNVLLKREVFDKYNLCFDENFKTGGSDQAFFKKAMEKGCRFVACNEAPVYEVVPTERWTKRYYINRALVNGFNSCKYETGASRFKTPVKSTVATIAYLFALPFCALIGIHRLMQCIEKGSYHLSRVLAVFGIELVKKRNF